MAFTNLTDMKLDISLNPDVSTDYTWQLNFEDKTGQDLYNSFRITNNRIYYTNSHFSVDVLVFVDGAWVNDDYRHIWINGGNDAQTQATLTWFDNNAVETPKILYTITTHLTGLTITGTLNILEDGERSLWLVANQGWTLPQNITVTGCDNVTYNSSTGLIYLENPYENVVITAMGDTTFQITVNVSHLTYIGANTIATGGTATGTLYPVGAYFLPQTISVNGASYTYDKNTGIINLSNPRSDIVVYAVGSEIDTSDLTMILYDNQAEKNRVYKAPKLTALDTIKGTLREEASIVKPVITFEYPSVPKINYVYIPNFGRYYYVDDIVSVRQNMWKVSLHVDVLMSYFTYIFNLSGTVERNEFEYNDLIEDNKLPSTSKDNYVMINPVTDSSFDIYHNYTRYVFSTSGIYTGSWTADWQYRKTFPSNDKYLIDAANLQTLFNEMNGTNFNLSNLFANEPLEALLSLRAYPFDVETVLGMGSFSTMKIHVGSWESRDAVGKWCGSRTDNQIGISGGIFHLLGDEWKDYTAHYSLYLPFYGFVDLEGYHFLNKYLLIWYDVDYDTGMGQVSLYTSDTSTNIRVQGDKPIMSFPCQISVNIPMTQSNIREQVKTAMDLVGMTGLAIGTSIATIASGGTLTPLMMGATAAAVGNKVNHMQKHIARGGSNASSWISNFLGVNPFVIKTTPDYYTPTNYAHLYGYPLHATRTLSSVSGFTKVGEIHMEDIPNAMVEEVDEIKRLLEEGVILP